MASSIFDVATFIKMIEKRPALWDSTIVVPGSKKESEWKEICMYYEPNFNHWDRRAQKQLENSMSKKWYSIKYRFTALARINREQNYIHYEHLKFLLKNLNRVNVSRKWERLHDVAKEGEITSTSYPNDDKERRLPRQKDSSGELATTSPEQDGIKPMNEPESDQKNMDVDEAFFISIMPNVKKLSDDEKLKFRVGVLNAVQSVTHQKPKKEIHPSTDVKPEPDIISLD